MYVAKPIKHPTHINININIVESDISDGAFTGVSPGTILIFDDNVSKLTPFKALVPIVTLGQSL
jgi:hypothetical protein